jgi:hypothetical protein
MRTHPTTTAPSPHLATSPGSVPATSWRPFAPVLTWAVATVVWAAVWSLDGLPHPFGDPEQARIGALFATSHPLIGTSVTVVLGSLAAGAALAMRHAPEAGAPETLGWLVAASVAFAHLHGALIAFLGYTPVALTVGWFDADLRTAYLATVTRADTLFLLWNLTGALLLARAALMHRTARVASRRSNGRGEPWTASDEVAVRDRALHIGRIAVAIAVASALVYPAVRLPWAFGHPAGMDAETFAELQASGADATGIALGVAGLVGAVLMLGLVQRWGERFPRWMVGLAGRRVPVRLAVVPAAVVAVALVTSGRGFLIGALGLVDLDGPVEPVHILPLLAMIPWGVALGVATAAYAVRRRSEREDR